MNLSFRIKIACLIVLAGSISCGALPRSDVLDLALGKPYQISPLSDYPLTKDASDMRKLTDGKYASGCFWTSRKETVGWQQSGTIRIDLDLRTSYAIDKICFDTARGAKADVSFPQSADMFISADGEHYKYLGDLMQGKDHSDGPYLVKKFCSSRIAAAGQYITLFVQPEGAFTFCDEIEVLGNGTKAKPGRVYTLKREGLSSFQKDLNYSSHYAAALRSADSNMAERVSSAIKKYPSLSGNMAELKGIGLLLTEPSFCSNLKKLQSAQNKLYKLNLDFMTRFKKGLIAWYKDPWAVFTPFDLPAPGQRIKGAVQFDLILRGAASEAVVLTNNSPGVRKYKVSVQTGGAACPYPHILVREALPVLLANGGLRADPLVIPDNGVVAIKPGESRQIWLTVLAGNCNAGTYVAHLVISKIGKKQTAAKIPLNIKIWRADMPKNQHLMADNWAYLNWRPIKDIPDQAVADLFAHHINVIVIPPWELPWPDLKLIPSGSKANYAKFDRALLYHKGARKFLFFLDYNNSDLRSFGGRYGFMSIGWRSVFRSWIDAWVKHLRGLGLSNDDFAFYPVDEPQNSEEAGYLTDAAKIIKEVDPGLRVFTTLDSLSRLNWFDMARIAHTIDIFQVSESCFPALNSSVIKKTGKPVWLYGGGGKSADPMGFFRLMAWRAFKEGIAGIGFWAYADTGPSGTAWNDLDGTRPDYSVVYEGKKCIISSKRWEAWREGVEDYELLLQAKGKLKPGLETEEFNRRLDHVIAHPDDYRYFKQARVFLLNIASRRN